MAKSFQLGDMVKDRERPGSPGRVTLVREMWKGGKVKPIAVEVLYGRNDDLRVYKGEAISRLMVVVEAMTKKGSNWDVE